MANRVNRRNKVQAERFVAMRNELHEAKFSNGRFSEELARLRASLAEYKQRQGDLEVQINVLRELINNTQVAEAAQ